MKTANMPSTKIRLRSVSTGSGLLAPQPAQVARGHGQGLDCQETQREEQDELDDPVLSLLGSLETRWVVLLVNILDV